MVAGWNRSRVLAPHGPRCELMAGSARRLRADADHDVRDRRHHELGVVPRWPHRCPDARVAFFRPRADHDQARSLTIAAATTGADLLRPAAESVSRAR